MSKKPVLGPRKSETKPIQPRATSPFPPNTIQIFCGVVSESSLRQKKAAWFPCAVRNRTLLDTDGFCFFQFGRRVAQRKINKSVLKQNHERSQSQEQKCCEEPARDFYHIWSRVLDGSWVDDPPASFSFPVLRRLRFLLFRNLSRSFCFGKSS